MALKNPVAVGAVGLVKVSGKVVPVKFTVGGKENMEGINLMTMKTVKVKTIAKVRALINRG